MSEDAEKPRRSGRGVITVFRTALAAMAASLVLILLTVFFILHTSTPARVAVMTPAPAVTKQERVTEPVRRIEPEGVAPVDLLPQRVTKVERVNVAVAAENAEPASGPTEPKSVNDSFCARYGLHKVITRGGRSWRCQK